MAEGLNFTGLDDKVSRKAGDLIHKALFTLEDLEHQCSTAYFNSMKNPLVGELKAHTASAVDTCKDEIVKRLDVLGVAVAYTIHDIRKGSDLQDFPSDLTDLGEIYLTIGENWRALLQLYRDVVSELRSIGDTGTAHLLEHQQVRLEDGSVALKAIVEMHQEAPSSSHDNPKELGEKY